MVYLLAAACGYAAIITVLFLFMCAFTEEIEALHNTEVERLSLELYQSRSILMDTQDMYDDLQNENRELRNQLYKGESS